MKNILIKMFSFILIIFACVGLTACGNNPPTTPPASEPTLTFRQRFNFVTADTVNELNSSESIYDIDHLQRFNQYKFFTLEVKQDFSFNHISFKVKGNSDSIENLYFSIEFENNGNVLADWTSDSTEISSTEKKFDIYCVVNNTNSYQYPYFQSDIAEFEKSSEFDAPKNMYFIFSVGTEKISTGYNSYKASGDIENPISFYDFNIE